MCAHILIFQFGDRNGSSQPQPSPNRRKQLPPPSSDAASPISSSTPPDNPPPPLPKKQASYVNVIQVYIVTVILKKMYGIMLLLCIRLFLWIPVFVEKYEGSGILNFMVLTFY